MIAVTGDDRKTAEDNFKQDAIFDEYYTIILKVKANGSQENISIKNFLSPIIDFLESDNLTDSTFHGQIKETIGSKTIYCAVSADIIDRINMLEGI